MEIKTIDARGLACPMPVINTKKVLETMGSGTVITIVDNEAARDNVATLAHSMGGKVEIQHKENNFHIRITKETTKNVQTTGSSTGTTVLFITSSEMGQGSSQLGQILMKSFIYTLTETENLPCAVLFINSAVYLTCEGSSVLEQILHLNQLGVEILSCGTCLDFLELKDKLRVGQVTNMYTIYEKLNLAEKLITL